MPKLTKARVLRVLKAARKADAAADGRRLKPEVRVPSASDRAAGKLVSNWMRTSGFDQRALDALRRRHNAERDKELERQIAADKRASLEPDALDIGLEKPLVGTGSFGLQAVAGLSFRTVTLTEPAFILTEPDSGVLLRAATGTRGSAAKVLLDTERSGTDKLNFIYTFRNDGSTVLLAGATTALTSRGRLFLRQSGELSLSLGAMDLSAQLEVRTLTRRLAFDSRFVAALAAASYQFWIDGEDQRRVSARSDLEVPGFVIPAGSEVLIVVSLLINRDFNPGRVVASLMVRCREVVLQLLGLP